MEHPPEIRIGEHRIVFLTDGFWRNDGGCMFGVVPRELWQKNHPPDELNRIRLNLTCPLIIRGADAILVDTGIGNRLSDKERRIFDHGEGWMLDGLRAIGMEPGDITAVVLSHLHFDHCGGVVRRRESGTLEAAFPRARLFIQRGELEIAQSSKNERLRAAYHQVEECLAPNVKSIEAIDGDLAIAPQVMARVTGGHTRDHQVVVVRGEGSECFAHLADIVPTRSHLGGPWNQAYDLDAITTMERKAEYLAEAVRERWWVSFAHDDRIYAARIVLQNGKLRIGETIAALEFL
ncbi:MAG TPA: MBL fold metallo-hydrolase [Candidatus Binataceae bacterium]|nr:MBL fold metallo-hydrolase [Candidatus Binataceae bacterium]